MRLVRINRILVALAVAVLAAGCHSSRHTTAPEPTIATVADTTAAVPQQRLYTVVNFTATVEGVSANGQLRVAEDSVMWLSVNKLIELGRALATPDSVWVNAPMFDKRFSGTYADLSRMAKRDVSFAQLQTIALGDDTEAQIRMLADMLGLDATVRITSRRTEPTLRFPFQKF